MVTNMQRGEVWWVDFEPSIGSEIQKKRPAIVVSNNKNNENSNRVVVVPLTLSTHKCYPSEALITVIKKSEGHTKSKAMADQIMTADKKRLFQLMGQVSVQDMRKVEDAIKLHLGLRK